VVATTADDQQLCALAGLDEFTSSAEKWLTRASGCRRSPVRLIRKLADIAEAHRFADF
jgi:hypothetical protein